ncbi:MAG: hypothetical protein QME81_05275 [bacterium]|nr:hypothetical protein [bacterium]
MKITEIAPMPLVEKESADAFALLHQFYQFCQISDEEEVISFIIKYPFLLSILAEAPSKIYPIFPKDDIALHLELHHDPEEDFEELFVVIKSPYSPEKARKLMDELDETWFLDIINKTKNKFCITEESL